MSDYWQNIRHEIDVWFSKQPSNYLSVVLAAKTFGRLRLTRYWNDPKAKYHW